MDDRRPAQAGAQNPAYRPTHPLFIPLTCGGALASRQPGHFGGHIPQRANARSRASRARLLASGTKWLYRSTVVVIDLWPSQRDSPGEALQLCVHELAQPDANYCAAQVYATLSLEKAVRDVAAELRRLTRAVASVSRLRR
jgi:hypothetical protein